MRYISAETPHDMEIFLAHVAVELEALGARISIDLYTDDPLTDEQASQTLQRAAEMARQQHEALPGRRRLFNRRDPLMGVELDLTRREHVVYFSRLAHRVINTEAWQNDHQLFGTIESALRLWVDLPDAALERTVAAAKAEGASVQAASAK